MRGNWEMVRLIDAVMLPAELRYSTLNCLHGAVSHVGIPCIYRCFWFGLAYTAQRWE